MIWTVSIIWLCVACRIEPVAEWNLSLINPVPTWLDDELFITAGVDWTPSPGVVEALEHGVAVPLKITTRTSTYHRWVALVDRDRNHRFEIRYLPLVRSYQLTELRSGEQSSYPRLTMMTASLREPRPWATGLNREEADQRAWQVQIRAELDRSRLPSPMRIPVWFDPQWRALSPWVAWRIGNAGDNG